MAAHPLPRRSRTWVAARGEHWEGSLRRARVRPRSGRSRCFTVWAHSRSKLALTLATPSLKGVPRAKSGPRRRPVGGWRVCQRADGQEQCGGIDGAVPLHPTPILPIWLPAGAPRTRVRCPPRRCSSVAGRVLDARTGSNLPAARFGRHAPALCVPRFSGQLDDRTPPGAAMAPTPSTAFCPESRAKGSSDRGPMSMKYAWRTPQSLRPG